MGWWLRLVISLRLALIVGLFWPALGLAAPVSLWQIQQGQATLFLLGSMHAVKPSLYPLPTVIEAAFSAADQLVLEIDLGLTTPAVMARALASRGTYPATENLSASLSTETLGLLTHYLQTHQESLQTMGLSLASVQQLRPWYLALLLSLHELTELGYLPALGIDQHYYEKAVFADKPVFGLETLESQIALVSAGTERQQEQMLRAAIDANQTIDLLLSTLTAAWVAGEIQQMYELAMTDQADYPELEDLMLEYLDQRNLQMAAKLRTYLDGDQTTLALVGALHLGGEQGLLALLSKDYTITQLQSSDP